MDVGDWLRSLGLGQYLALFREHAIDAEVLPELTDADLEKFGVPFGHRKRLIKAIANLAAAPREQAETAPPAPATRLAEPCSATCPTDAREARTLRESLRNEARRLLSVLGELRCAPLFEDSGAHFVLNPRPPPWRVL